MSELSPTSGELPRAPAVGLTEAARRKTPDFNITIVLLVIVGVASLIVCEQVLTGWLALGERANIPRSNLNLIELAVAAGTLLWGLVTLRTALGFIRHESLPSLDDYFGGSETVMTPGVLLTIALLGVIGVISLVLAEQVLTGWLALGERANIPRRHLNGVEIAVIIAGTLWGLVTLRTVFSLSVRDRRAWAWAQWVLLITAIIALALLANGVFDLPTIIPARSTILSNLPGLQELTAPGLLLFLSSVAAYRFITIGVDTTAGQHVRNSLSKVPGAGAIIGFFAIFIFFSLTSDLFLTERSLAGITATNISRGIVAIGITFLMISGEFDLSVGSVFGAGALVFLLMMTEGLPAPVLVGVPLFVIGLVVVLSGYANERSRDLIIGGALLLGAVLAAPVLGLLELDGVVVTPASPIPAAIIALCFAGLLGLINGTILIRTGIPSFIVTLGTLLAYRAILLVVVADGRILRYADYRLPPPNVYINRWLLVVVCLAIAIAIAAMGFQVMRSYWKRFAQRLSSYASDASDFRDFWLALYGVLFLATLVGTIAIVLLLLDVSYNQIGQEGTLIEISFFDIMNGQFGFVSRDVNLRAGVAWWFLLVVVFQFILTQTRYGNHVLAVGGNPGAARAQGINVNVVKVMNFVICSMLACLAGMISVARLANVDPLMGNGLELEVIAASVIGGALLAGGYGSIVGSLLGVLIFGMLQTGLVLIGVDARSFSGIVGIIIIVAVVINTAVRQARR